MTAGKEPLSHKSFLRAYHDCLGHGHQFEKSEHFGGAARTIKSGVAALNISKNR